jgi:hypothetical protein
MFTRVYLYKKLVETHQTPSWLGIGQVACPTNINLRARASCMSDRWRLRNSRLSCCLSTPVGGFWPTTIPMVSVLMKNVQIGGRTCLVLEFEDTMVLDSELETNMEIKYTWLIIWHKYFMEGKYCMSVGTQLNVFHASKLFVWLNYMKYHSTKKKYESWKTCNTWESFHVYKFKCL